MTSAVAELEFALKSVLSRMAGVPPDPVSTESSINKLTTFCVADVEVHLSLLSPSPIC